MPDPLLHRRDFLRTVAITGGTLAAGGLWSGCEPTPDHAHHGLPLEPAFARGGGGGKPVTRNPLRIPPTLSPSNTLRAAPGTVTVVPGKSTEAWMYNGEFPAPTLVAAHGDTVTPTFVNGLAQDSIIHWHGVLPDPANDGHPRDVVGPLVSRGYSFQIDQRAALCWYHPHPHMHTGEQVYRGLAGAFILRDNQDTGTSGNAFGLPVGGYEIPLIIRDASFDSAGAFRFSNKASGFWGNVPLVNGTLDPALAVDRGVYRFRMLNGCNARVLRLALSDGTPFTLIGNDGGLLDRVYQVQEITAAPGERFDILLDFAGLAKDASIMLRDLDAGWDVLQFTGTGQAGPGSLPAPGSALSPIQPLPSPVDTRSFSFDGMTRINGKVYDINAIEFTVPFGVTERWIFVTNGNGPHPVHVHGASFQVQSRSGGRGQLYDWEKGWKDTVLVNDGETVEVLIRFDAHPGLYIMHCHQLAHEDAGMMANFEVLQP